MTITEQPLETTGTAPRPTTIVLIHGLWMTPLCWEHWIERYQRAGYRVIAPAWPGLDGSVEDLRANTAAYARLRIPEILDHYTRIIEALDSPPIIMGHSFGGAPAVSREAAQHSESTTSVTDYREYPGRSHYTLGQEGWETVADEALAWAGAHAQAAAAATR
jgi:pimeloyl-ACP methyl ester carboxylesterase